VSPVEKQFSQSELEAIAAALGDTSEGLTGSEIGHTLATLKMADPNPDMTKWKRLHNAFVERQNYSQNRRAILEFIRQAMKPERSLVAAIISQMVGTPVFSDRTEFSVTTTNLR